MKHSLLFIALTVAICSCSSTVNTDALRTVEDFNFGWAFNLGDSIDYSAPEFDDSSWRKLHLPHDWSIEGDFSIDNPSTPSGGALPGGIGWYRKQFATPEGVADGDKRVFIEFDGVFMNSSVYVNGRLMGARPYGYSSFTYDITEALATDGSQNVMAVRCDNELQPNSRWYAGCGIYRNVRLVTVNPTHVAWSGTFVQTPEIGDNAAKVLVDVSLEGEYAGNAVVRNFIRAANGRMVAQGEASKVGGNVFSASLDVKNPHLWDIEDTYLYTMESEVLVDGKVVDRYNTPFGIRSIRFSVDSGFFLNGRRVELQGVCLHHDMGCIGTAVHFRALQRELEILQSYGVNAIRTSHNPPAPELLQLADEMGFLVIDEAFDMWRKNKTQYDYARFFDQWHEKDLSDFIKRDRNHPCVIMWSVGNELGEQSDSRDDRLENLSPEQANLLLNFMESFTEYEQGDNSPNVVLAKHVGAIVKNLDKTRPVTAGCNMPNPANNLYKSGITDVFGANYGSPRYDAMREGFQGVPLYGSETASSINSRGYYPQKSTDTIITPREWWLTRDGEEGFEDTQMQLPSYDNCRVPWGALAEDAWVAVRDRIWLAGTFVWTGFDYLGEPTPYGWPARSSYFGIVDLAGFPKDVYWMYKSEWTDDTVLHLFPHWNWKEGDKVDIWAYFNNADEVELFVNGKSYGRDHKDGAKLHARWLQVPFEAGVIEAVSYKDGKEVARTSNRTTGKPESLKLTADRSVIDADGYDLSYITVEAVDADGLVVPDADIMLSFKVDGNGELFGVDNGNATDTLSLKGNRKQMFAGKALAVIRSLKDCPGTATLTVSSSLGETKLDVTVSR